MADEGVEITEAELIEKLTPTEILEVGEHVKYHDDPNVGELNGSFFSLKTLTAPLKNLQPKQVSNLEYLNTIVERVVQFQNSDGEKIEKEITIVGTADIPLADFKNLKKVVILHNGEEKEIRITKEMEEMGLHYQTGKLVLVSKNVFEYWMNKFSGNIKYLNSLVNKQLKK